MTDEATQPIPQEPQAGTAVALRPHTRTEEWLSKQTGVEILDTPHGRVISLPPTLGDRVNLLTPATQIVQVDPNFSPIPRVVQLDIREHAYEETKAGKGKFALNAKALDQLAAAAGIGFEPPQADYMAGAGFACTIVGTRRGPDGTPETWSDMQAVLFDDYRRTARRERAEQIARWSDPPTGDALEELLDKHVDEQMKHVFSKTTTKAKSRVVRHWLAVKSAYTPAELKKPFLVIQWALTPDRDDPNVAQIIDLQFQRSHRELYGSVPRPRPALTVPRRADEPPALDAGDPGPERSANVDEHGEVDGEGEPVDAEIVTEPAADVPPRPATAETITGGRWQGMTVDQVVADADGRQWLLANVGRIRDPRRAAHLLAWLSHAEGRFLSAEDCGALARERAGAPS